MALSLFDDPSVPDDELWDVPDRLTWEECVDATAFPSRRSDREDEDDDA